MAHSTIVFKHPVFGTQKEAPVGFSWTTFFFGFFPALFRGDFKWAGIQFVVFLLIGIATAGFGSIVASIAFAFFYNKLYIKELLDKGYKVESIRSAYTLEQLQAQVEAVLTTEPATEEKAA